MSRRWVVSKFGNVSRPTEEAALSRVAALAKKLACTEYALISAFAYLRGTGEIATPGRLRRLVIEFEEAVDAGLQS